MAMFRTLRQPVRVPVCVATATGRRTQTGQAQISLTL